MDEALIKRVQPQSIEAEQSVIGAMLMDREAIIAASEIVVADDFYQRQYGVMFEAMVELFNEGKPVDLVTLQDRLKEKDVPPEVCSLEFVRDIMETVPTSVNVRSYAEIVHEKAVMRRLIRINEEIANSCYAGKERLEDILADTEKQIFGLLQSRMSGDFVPIRQVALNVLDKIEQATCSYTSSGILQLNERSKRRALRAFSKQARFLHTYAPLPALRPVRSVSYTHLLLRSFFKRCLYGFKVALN